MRLRTGMMAVGAACALAVGVAAPAFAAGEPKLGATFTDRDATDGKIAIYIDGCESDMVTSVSEAFAGTDWNPDTDILTIQLRDGLEEGVHTATTTCVGMKPVWGKFEYRDGKVGVPGFTNPPLLRATFTDRDATDGKVALYIDNCKASTLTSVSPAFTNTRWNPKTDILTVSLKDNLKEGVYAATTTCAGMKPVWGEFEYRDGLVGVPGFGGPTPLKAAYTDRDATDGKIGVRITGCASDKLAVVSPAFADTRWHPKTDILTATLKDNLEEGIYHATTFCEGLTAVHGKFEYRDGMVGVPGFGGETDESDRDKRNDKSDKPVHIAPEQSLPEQDQTSVIPEGGVQTGGGGTVSGQS